MAAAYIASTRSWSAPSGGRNQWKWIDRTRGFFSTRCSNGRSAKRAFVGSQIATSALAKVWAHASSSRGSAASIVPRPRRPSRGSPCGWRRPRRGPRCAPRTARRARRAGAASGPRPCRAMLVQSTLLAEGAWASAATADRDSALAATKVRIDPSSPPAHCARLEPWHRRGASGASRSYGRGRWGSRGARPSRARSRASPDRAAPRANPSARTAATSVARTSGRSCSAPRSSRPPRPTP